MRNIKDKTAVLNLKLFQLSPPTLCQNVMKIDGQTEGETRMLAIYSNAKKKGKAFAVEITTNPSFYNSNCPEWKSHLFKFDINLW